MITLTQKRQDGSYVIVGIDHDDVAGSELAELFRAFMLAAGYHPDTVKDCIGVESE